ncbi:hypothetical protein [Tepidibacter thalassicus]|uniref:Uncharacterized protein n=1 Tax=Tepidibacter thalassicus DSM 15285 TaxID=1123350 RepID=A0A1M5NPS2_9FIRM|nr:hypothetical protein [Tepidibacter thalassicus]SHG91498.1 hypothetical protein SAMN02744040_00155 [Tepidibacter thalassicus DSM 15285]
MIYKYSFDNLKDILSYSDVESKVKNVLSEYNFVDGIEYDGEYINIVINKELKQIAKENELNLNKAIENFRKSC